MSQNDLDEITLALAENSLNEIWDILSSAIRDIYQYFRGEVIAIINSAVLSTLME